MTIQEIEKQIEDLKTQKETLIKAEKEKLAKERAKRKAQVDKAYDTYLELLNKFVDDYGNYDNEKEFNFTIDNHDLDWLRKILDI